MGKQNRAGSGAEKSLMQNMTGGLAAPCRRQPGQKQAQPTGSASALHVRPGRFQRTAGLPGTAAVPGRNSKTRTLTATGRLGRGPPAAPSARGTASVGAVGKSRGSVAASPKPRILPTTGRLCCRTAWAEASTTAAAPSLMGEALPAAPGAERTRGGQQQQGFVCGLAGDVPTRKESRLHQDR